MKIRLVSHASIIAETSDTKIWTDPWLYGKAFNESWSLLAPAAYREESLDSIDYLWISHEHPDHFHTPTLRSLPQAFKSRVTILFQRNNSAKLFETLGKLGFPNHCTLPHRKILHLTETTSVYCYQVGQMDSALGVLNHGEIVLNVNDAEINTRDCRIIRSDIGNSDVVLNQFSIAGYSGHPDRERGLSELAARILENVSDNHRDLGAKVTIPIASFIRFSTADNEYVNRFANTPRDVSDYCGRRGQEVVALFHGDDYEVKSRHDSSSALGRWDAVYNRLDALPIDPVDAVPLDRIAEALRVRSMDLGEKFPRFLLRRLKPVIVRIPDLEATVRFSVPDGSLEILDDSTAPDLAVNSQPLEFAFKTPFGVQTLGVSARITVFRNQRNWKLHRIIFSLNNAELYLRPRSLLSFQNLGFLMSRLRGSFNQLSYQLKRMR